MRYLLPFTLLLSLLLTACGGKNFDESAIPPEQLSTELAFKRMAEHGELEPVVDAGLMIDGWQFHVGSTKEGSYLGSEKVKTVYLSDRSGIDYFVTSKTSPGIIDKLELGTYGFARGRVHAVERDLAAGEMEVELLLSGWTERK